MTCQSNVKLFVQIEETGHEHEKRTHGKESKNHSETSKKIYMDNLNELFVQIEETGQEKRAIN